MKKLMLVFVSAVMFLAVSASAQSLNAGFGLGGSYPKAPDSIGFDSKVFVDVGLNKFFALGIESGFGWIKRSSGDEIKFDGGTMKATSSLNFYSIPLLLTATVFFPVGEYESPLKPYISGGAGYSWTVYSSANDPTFDKKNTTFHGFTWQAVVGIDYNLGSDANNMSVFLEGGYRGTMLEKKYRSVTYELDMSGAFVKVGVSFPIIAASDY